MTDLTFKYDLGDESVFIPNAPAFEAVQPLALSSAYGQGTLVVNGGPVSAAFTAKLMGSLDDQAGGDAAVRSTLLGFSESTFVYDTRKQWHGLLTEPSESGLALSAAAGLTLFGEFFAEPAGLTLYGGIKEQEFGGEFHGGAFTYTYNGGTFPDGTSTKTLRLATFDTSTYADPYVPNIWFVAGAEEKIPLLEGLRLVLQTASMKGASASWTTTAEADLNISEKSLIRLHGTIQTPPASETEFGETISPTRAFGISGKQVFGAVDLEVGFGLKNQKIEGEGFTIISTFSSFNVASHYQTPWERLILAGGVTLFPFREKSDGFVSSLEKTLEFGGEFDGAFNLGRGVTLLTGYFLVAADHKNDVQGNGTVQGAHLGLKVNFKGAQDL